MAELLPLVQAENIRKSMLDYLTTTFALTDPDAAAALEEFLQSPEDGIFRGPFVKTSLPFYGSEEGSSALEWDPGFTPYGHQSAAFARLASSRDGLPVRPSPTVVTTGTGSGKTEAFLYPILDHVVRMRRKGQDGIKALILYPMNALANDQAGRLAKLLTTDPALEGITAAVYTGQAGPERTVVSSEGLITDRYTIRSDVPDILLTNYKMLDQLLLREADQVLWQKSADSLQYLVLDEFHTYDGAQGTDVAMLLRRLGLALRHYGDPELLSEEDQARPLGRVTPVATSATLGAENTAEMLRFAETVFGETFTEEALVGETRQSVVTWVGDAPAVLRDLGFRAVSLPEIRVQSAVNALRDTNDPQEITSVIMDSLLDPSGEALEKAGLAGADADPALQEIALKASPLVQALVAATSKSVSLADLAEAIPELSELLGGTKNQLAWTELLGGVLNALGHVRSKLGRSALSTEVHLWLRELKRIDRLVSDDVRFYWSDEGARAPDPDEADPKDALPAIYCRRCGRSGWAVELAPVGTALSSSDAGVRLSALNRNDRVRYLISTPLESDIGTGEVGGGVSSYSSGVSGSVAGETTDVAWLNMRQRDLTNERPDFETDEDFQNGWVQPVLTNDGKDAAEQSKNQTCPACEAADSIRFMGSAISTMLSVSISTLFGAPGLDDMEKHALVFTDSVQDAAHRAGFVTARSHSLSLRSVLADAIGDEEITLDELPALALDRAGEDPIKRHRLVPPALTDHELFAAFWDVGGTSSSQMRASRNAVASRLAFDAALEFGLNAAMGRTLELTGSVNVQVDVGSDAILLNAAKTAIEEVGFAPDLLGELEAEASGNSGSSGARLTDQQLLHWVRGTVVRIRTQGGIIHPWLSKYIESDGNRYFIWGGRDRAKGMPAFPSGRPAPAFPRVGGRPVKYEQFDSVSSPMSWYARWAGRVLGVSGSEGGRLAVALLRHLEEEGSLRSFTTKSGATVYGFEPSQIVLTRSDESELESGLVALECELCRSVTPVAPKVAETMLGAPCSSLRCAGTLRAKPLTDNFYRQMYTGSPMRRVISREHTGLLDDELRLKYEEEFKNPSGTPNSPNVLVATPTLEMGIDIGDLSAVFLSSIPKATSNYRQRVGRAGRRTGNALALTYGTGYGVDLARVKDPSLMIEGPIRPPATYLTAEELLRRQYTAVLADRLARDPRASHPQRASGAIGSAAPGQYLGELIALGEARACLSEFTEGLGEAGQAAREILERWTERESEDAPASSKMAKTLAEASAVWNADIEELGHRISATEKLLPELETKAESPAATKEDEQAFRDAKASLRRARGRRADLQHEHWVAVLEEFGVLPNYTLFDDSVTLGVGLSWRNTETGEFEPGQLEVSRPSAMALREFAPGSTFYVQGLEIQIDAVDMGSSGDAIEQWVTCSQCGFIDTEGHEYAACPRCGGAGIADTGAKISVVPLRRATADVRREESRISDNSDDRRRKVFEAIEAIDFPEKELRKQWSVPHTIGVQLFDSVDVRTLNLGSAGRGAEREIAGRTMTPSLFRLCEGCGKEDQKAGTNPASEHRPWCRYRNTAEEKVRTVALAHSLRTQGLVLHLPAKIALDSAAKASLVAAVRAGLREVLGGDPDHLQVTTTPIPEGVGQGTTDGLLLYDRIPGGTGYLSDWAEPETLFSVLEAALDVVQRCDCDTRGHQSCHNCLLPYAPRSQSHLVSRAAAELALQQLLSLEEGEAPDFTKWEIQDEVLDMGRSTESALETQFREALRPRLEKLVSLKTTATSDGEAWRFGSADRKSGRTWSLEPQVDLGFTRPDFLLRCTDIDVPDVAIYTDGYEFHASPANLRVDDDAEKRNGLRAKGMVVLSAISADVQPDPSAVPPLLPTRVLEQLQQDPRLQTTPSSLQMVQSRPVDWIIDWIAHPQPEDLAHAARSVPFGLPPGGTPVQADATVSLETLAYRLLSGENPETAGKDSESGGGADGGDTNRTVVVHRDGDVLFLTSMEPEGTVGFLVALDDEQAPSRQSWELWLRYSNAVALRDWPTAVVTYRQLADQLTHGPIPRTPVSHEPQVDLEALPAAWRELAEESGVEGEVALFAALAAAGVETLPELGGETDSGIPFSLVWEGARLAVPYPDSEPEDIQEAEGEGWTVVAPDADKIVEALKRAEG